MWNTEDGHIPKNKYGNIEIFNGPLPKKTCWVQHIPKIMDICRKLKVEAVVAVVELKRYPVKKGAVIFWKDLPAIVKEKHRMQIKSEKNLPKKVKKEAKNA